MRKEFKIGMFLGLDLVIIGIIYLSTRKSVSVEYRTLEQTQHIAGPNLPALEVNLRYRRDANVRAAIAAALDANAVHLAAGCQHHCRPDQIRANSADKDTAVSHCAQGRHALDHFAEILSAQSRRLIRFTRPTGMSLRIRIASSPA